jgi:hypothetical protein
MTNSSHLLATVNLVLGGLVFLLGFVILRENPRQRLNRVVSMLLLFGGLGAVLAALTLLVPDTGGGAGLQSNVAYLWELFFPTAFLLASIFPEEREFVRPFTLPGGMRSPNFILLVFSPHAFHFLLVVVTSFLPAEAASHASVGFGRSLLDLLAVVGKLFLSIHQSLFSLVDLFFGAAAVALLIAACAHAGAARAPAVVRDRGRARLSRAVRVRHHDPDAARPAARARDAGFAHHGRADVGSGSIAYAMVRHKFLDTKLIARRGILYALASAVLIGFYLTVIDRVNRMVAGAFHIDARVVEPVLLIIALTLFQPAVAKLEDSLDQVFLRDPTDYRNVLRALGRELQTSIDLEDLLNRSIRTLTERCCCVRRHRGDHRRRPDRAHAGDALSQSRSRAWRRSWLGSRRRCRATGSDRSTASSRGPRAAVCASSASSSWCPALAQREPRIVAQGEDRLLEFTSEDVTLLNNLICRWVCRPERAAARPREVARIEEELNLAHQIQQTFLKNDFPALPRCEVYAINLPSRQVGGDYYDVVTAPDGSFLVAIADVAGKGVPAALLSSMLQAALRTQAHSVRSPAEILRNVNSLVQHCGPPVATFFLAHVSADGRRMTYRNAGQLARAAAQSRRTRVVRAARSSENGNGDGGGRASTCRPYKLVFYTDGIVRPLTPRASCTASERLVEFVSNLPPLFHPEATPRASCARSSATSGGWKHRTIARS